MVDLAGGTGAPSCGHQRFTGDSEGVTVLVNGVNSVTVLMLVVVVKVVMVS